MRTEKGLAITFLIGILFKLMHWPGASLILVLSLSTLAIIYFPGAFYFFCDKVIKKSNLALSIISGLLLSIIPIGILFKLQYWPGAGLYLLIGSVAAPIILILTLVLKSKAADELKTYYKNMTLRAVVLAAFSLILYLTPTATLVHLQYREDPEMARLKAQFYTHPENEEYRKQHDEYLMKRDSIYFQEMQDFEDQ